MLPANLLNDDRLNQMLWMLMHHNEQGSVYLIADEDRQAVKIGWSRNPYLRACQLRTGSSGTLTLKAYFPGSRQHEATLHRLFKDSRLNGEWFNDQDGAVTIAFMRIVGVKIHEYATELQQVSA